LAISDLQRRCISRVPSGLQDDDRGATPLATLEKIYTLAKDLGLRFPYLGNVYNHPYENTYCPVCGVMLIGRQGFSSTVLELDGSSAGTVVKRSRLCAMCPESRAETQFITDRMLGTLSRYLRFMGYNTLVPMDLPRGMQKRIPFFFTLRHRKTASCSRVTPSLHCGERSGPF